ncbi:elongation factor P [Candidatus Dojkabacteria bacterium]|nr:elongation factor P [Candidatus Dojkabacteria bacterium]
MSLTSNINKGMYILFKGEPHVVLERQMTSQGRVSAFKKTKLKSLVTGRVLDQTFKSTDKVEEIDVETKSMQYIYVDGNEAYFMDPATFEQIPVTLDLIAGGTSYLHPDAKYVMMFYDGSPLAVNLPPSITLEITKTTGAVKGNTATGATKNATVETGYQLQVPLFISEGDKVSINTSTGEYTEKAN